MKLACLSCFLLLCLNVFAQDEVVKKLSRDSKIEIKKQKDTLNLLWRRGGQYGLNLSQGSLSNWAAGGDNFSLAVTSVLNLFAFYKNGKHSWDNTFDFNLGYLKTSTLGSRKNDDRIDLLSKYGRQISKKWNLSGLVNFRSQLFKGYTVENDTSVFSSAFLSPAYVLGSIGADYKPTEFLSVFISPVTARWVIVKNDSLAAKGLYGVDSGQHVKTELGAFVTANFLKEFNQVFSYKARLDLFSNYRHNPQNIDVFFTNVFSVKFSKVLSANWNIDLIYDDDVRLFGKEGNRPAVQIKSIVGAGLVLKF